MLAFGLHSNFGRRLEPSNQRKGGCKNARHGRTARLLPTYIIGDYINWTVANTECDSKKGCGSATTGLDKLPDVAPDPSEKYSNSGSKPVTV